MPITMKHTFRAITLELVEKLKYLSGITQVVMYVRGSNTQLHNSLLSASKCLKTYTTVMY